MPDPEDEPPAPANPWEEQVPAPLAASHPSTEAQGSSWISLLTLSRWIVQNRTSVPPTAGSAKVV